MTTTISASTVSSSIANTITATGGRNNRAVSHPRTIETLNFNNFILDELPVDNRLLYKVERQVKDAVFASVVPSPVNMPKLVCFSSGALQLLDLDMDEAKIYDDFSESEKIANYFSGNNSIPGTRPVAHCYCG